MCVCVCYESPWILTVFWHRNIFWRNDYVYTDCILSAEPYMLKNSKCIKS